MKEPRKIREGKIQGNYFLVPTMDHCYKVNVAEQEILNEILTKHGKKPTKSIVEKFNGKKLPVMVRVDVPLYLEIEETLGKYRQEQKANKS